MLSKESLWTHVICTFNGLSTEIPYLYIKRIQIIGYIYVYTYQPYYVTIKGVKFTLLHKKKSIPVEVNIWLWVVQELLKRVKICI